MKGIRMKRILLIEHAPNRAEGFIAAHDEFDLGSELVVWRCYESNSPPTGDWDGLIIGGGPMMVSDLEAGTFSFYGAERSLIESTITADKPVLGVCLGSQILCHLFGGKVGPLQWVAGWHQVNLNERGMASRLFTDVQESFMTFQYHRDHFLELPSTAIPLAGSDTTVVESFLLQSGKRVWATLFHPEMDVHFLMQLFQARPDLFTSHGVDKQMLAPLDDCRKARRKILHNFFCAVLQE